MGSRVREGRPLRSAAVSDLTASAESAEPLVTNEISMLPSLTLASLMGSALAREPYVYDNEFYKRDGGSHHHSPAPVSSYDAPSYTAPAPSYAAPSYSAPAPSYAVPTDAYASPDSGYSAPTTGYASPVSSYGDVKGGLDLTSILIPLLALLGLSLLFPTYVNLTSVKRRRRSLDEDSTENSLVERVQDIYMAVVESEECMERVACEVGGIAADAGVNKGMTKLAESFVPKKYQKMMKNFNSAKDCHKIKCGAF